MKWSERYNANQLPSLEDVKEHMGKSSSLWEELSCFIENNYHVQPRMTYSKCVAQPGWNIKYQKSGKSLCTIYPMDGYFISLVVIGAKEEEEAEKALGTLTPYVEKLYRTSPFSCGGRWLMIEVKDESILEDVKCLIKMRVKPKDK